MGSEKLTQIFIAKLSSRINEDDLDYYFGKFGKIRKILLKRNFAFVVSF